MAAEQSPHIAFIELCIAGSQPSSTIQTLLADVPGQATPDLPVQMLLGHSWRLVTAHVVSAEQILLRLYGIARAVSFPEDIYYTLSGYEDVLSLARDGVYGTVANVAHEFLGFLADYKSYAPDLPTGIA